MLAVYHDSTVPFHQEHQAIRRHNGAIYLLYLHPQWALRGRGLPGDRLLIIRYKDMALQSLIYRDSPIGLSPDRA
jgi:hypothetical protein